MEVSMNLTQAMNTILKTPSPIDTPLFDLLEHRPIDDFPSSGIAVDEAHDAFRVSDQFPNPPDVQLWLIALNAVNFDQVVAQRVGPRHIEFCELGIIPHSGKVFEVSAPLRVFSQYEELLSVAQ